MLGVVSVIKKKKKIVIFLLSDKAMIWNQLRKPDE